MKNQKGISLIALIITIIVIIILAAIVITMSLKTPEQANFAKYCNAIGELQEKVTVCYGEVFTNHTIKGEVRSRAQIFQEVATGTDVTGAANEYNEITATKYVGALPSIQNSDGDSLHYYVTGEGLVFNYPAFDYEDGDTTSYYYSNSKNEATALTSEDDAAALFNS